MPEKSINVDDQGTGSITFDENPESFAFVRSVEEFRLWLPASASLRTGGPDGPCPMVSNLHGRIEKQGIGIGCFRDPGWYIGAEGPPTPVELAWDGRFQAMAAYEGLRDGGPVTMKVFLWGELCFLYQERAFGRRLRSEPRRIFGQIDLEYPPEKWTRMIEGLFNVPPMLARALPTGCSEERTERIWPVMP